MKDGTLSFGIDQILARPKPEAECLVKLFKAEMKSPTYDTTCNNLSTSCSSNGFTDEQCILQNRISYTLHNHNHPVNHLNDTQMDLKSIPCNFRNTPDTDYRGCQRKRIVSDMNDNILRAKRSDNYKYNHGDDDIDIKVHNDDGTGVHDVYTSIIIDKYDGYNIDGDDSTPTPYIHHQKQTISKSSSLTIADNNEFKQDITNTKLSINMIDHQSTQRKDHELEMKCQGRNRSQRNYIPKYRYRISPHSIPLKSRNRNDLNRTSPTEMIIDSDLDEKDSKRSSISTRSLSPSTPECVVKLDSLGKSHTEYCDHDIDDNKCHEGDGNDDDNDNDIIVDFTMNVPPRCHSNCVQMRERHFNSNRLSLPDASESKQEDTAARGLQFNRTRRCSASLTRQRQNSREYSIKGETNINLQSLHQKSSNVSILPCRTSASSPSPSPSSQVSTQLYPQQQPYTPPSPTTTPSSISSLEISPTTPITATTTAAAAAAAETETETEIATRAATMSEVASAQFLHYNRARFLSASVSLGDPLSPNRFDQYDFKLRPVLNVASIPAAMDSVRLLGDFGLAESPRMTANDLYFRRWPILDKNHHPLANGFTPARLSATAIAQQRLSYSWVDVRKDRMSCKPIN